MLGYSPSRTADSAGLSGEPHLLACLAAFRNKNCGASVKACSDVYNLLYFSFLIVGDEWEIPLILEILGGMEFAVTDTCIQGVQAIIVSGKFHQWRLAVIRGCNNNQSEAIIECFNKIYLQFKALGLTDAFGNLTKRIIQDGHFSLEEHH